MNPEADIFDKIRGLLCHPGGTFVQVTMLKQLREELANAFSAAGKNASWSNIQTINGLYARLAKLEREIMMPLPTGT